MAHSQCSGFWLQLTVTYFSLTASVKLARCSFFCSKSFTHQPDHQEVCETENMLEARNVFYFMNTLFNLFFISLHLKAVLLCSRSNRFLLRLSQSGLLQWTCSLISPVHFPVLIPLSPPELG